MDFTPIVQAIITLATAIITYLLVPWIKSKTTAEQREAVYGWVKIAVAALEQAYRDSPKKGLEKKKAVREFLAARGITYDEAALDKMIEAAVYEMTNGGIIAESVTTVEVPDNA